MNYSSLLPAGSMADNTTTVAVSSFYGSRQTFDWIDLLILLLVLGLLFASGPLWAQAAPAGLVDLDSLKAEANVPNDMATSIFNNLFGPIFASPFTAAGGATTLFGVIFLAFNVVVFSAGVVWATYGVVAGVVQSAHEGVVLGKRMSAIWMPIRMVTGIGSLVPAFGGFSLSQVVMIFAAGWGITFGNYAYLKALDAASNFTPLVNLNVPLGNQTKSPEDLAKAIFEQELCVIDAQTHQSAYAAAGNSVPVNDVVSVQPAAVFQAVAGSTQSIGVTYGTLNDPARCGSVGLRYVGDATRSATSFFGFRSSNVDYNAISQGVYNRHQGAYPAFDTQVRNLARNWVAAVNDAALNPNAAAVPVPEAQLLQAATSYTSSTVGSAGSASANGAALKEAAFENMKQYGFLGAGAFYSTFAELNSSIGQATQAVNFVIVGPSGAATISDENSSSDRSRFRAAYAKQSAAQNAGDSTLRAPPGGSCADSGSSGLDILTGKCSLGQTAVDYLLRGATAGSSVGGSGGFRIIDPIIAAKNLGDYMMTTGVVLFGIMKAVEPDAGKADASVAGKAVSALSNFNPIKWIGIAAAKLAGSMLAMLPLIAGLLFGLGALLSIYIPMVPFINWVSAIVQYVSTVVEAMAAAPLWSFAHLQPDGEGMGSRTERGYIYLLLMLFTPILMVVGFFAACGLVILTGTAVLWLFMPAMANVQGNSITGVFSVIGFVFIFFLLMNILIQGLFNLTMDLKDDVIGWIGNVGRSQIGRDTESKASNMFVMGGRIGQQQAQMSIAGAMAQPKKQSVGGNAKVEQQGRA